MDAARAGWDATSEGDRVDRLRAEDWYREALGVLGEQGSEALTIAVMCERLQITKGSFYHHFGSMAGFVRGLLQYWEREHNERLIALSEAQADPHQRILALTDIGLELPHASEGAIRAWGRSNPDIAAVVDRVDQRRVQHIADAVAALGADRNRAQLLAHLSTTVLVGAQTREHPVDHERLRQMFVEVTRLVFLEADSAPPATLAPANG